MTYLGLDTSHHLSDAHRNIISVVRSGTTALRSRIASPLCKLDVLRMQLYPKFLYPATKACWSLAEYYLLDGKLAVMLKQTSRYMHSTATDMQFFIASHGSTGQHNCATASCS